MSVGVSQAEQGSVPVETVHDSIGEETKRLRRHLGLGDFPGLPSSTTPPACTPLFFIERAPSSRNGAMCKLPTCSDRIKQGMYRVVLNPGMSGPGWIQASNKKSGKYNSRMRPRVKSEGREPNSLFFQTCITSYVSRRSPICLKSNIWTEFWL